MSDTHYTPTIDEFHDGFEYERMNGDRWEEAEFDSTDGWGTLAHGYENEYEEIDKGLRTVKVKYLDREDIESLGFEYDNNGEPYSLREPEKEGDLYDFPLAFNLDTQLTDGICYILYLYKDSTVWIEWIKDCAGMGYIFKGVIKNKSELVKLMKQLGIL